MFFKMNIFTFKTYVYANIFSLFEFIFYPQRVNALTVKHVYDEIPQGKAGCYSILSR